MWPNDFIEALNAFSQLTKGSVLIESIAINLWGDRFIIRVYDVEYYYIYMRDSKTLFKQWPDSWRNKEHPVEKIGEI